jgi:hypothetical protein
MKATLRLFKAIPVENKNEGLDPKVFEMTIPYGFAFAPEIYGNYSHNELINLAKMAAKELGLSGQQMNSSFHKSWGKVSNASMHQLVMEQILHYLTTYGFERMGIFSEDSIYIPAEELNIPEFEGINLIVVKGLTKEELTTKLMDLLKSGAALAEDTIKDVLDVALFVELSETDVLKVKNKEVKIALFDFFGIVPGMPTEFLRYVLFKAIGKTLLIKDRATIEVLKSQNNSNLAGLFSAYEKKYGLEPLASIFYRFKPIFLALRTNDYLKRKINRIRKMADKCHVPMQEDFLNSVTAHIKTGFLNINLLKEELEKVNIFRKVRLAHALNYRVNAGGAILYKVRNGKGFATEFESVNKGMCQDALQVVIETIGADLRPSLDGKKIFIPENLVYSVPATEKQFTGMFPSGTYIKTNRDLIVGIYWENVDRQRIDLDLSMLELNFKIGWDALPRTSERDVLFSGDMTDASKGATELYYIKGQKEKAYMIMVNYFNADYSDAPDVPFKILAASEVPSKNFEGHRKNDMPYMVDPNNIIAQTGSKMVPSQKQKILGLVVTAPDECRFYFSEFNAGNSITSGFKPYNVLAREYLINYHRSILKLSDVLLAAGASIEREEVYREECDIDLSPEKLEKDTFIKLLTGK